MANQPFFVRNVPQKKSNVHRQEAEKVPPAESQSASHGTQDRHKRRCSLGRPLAAADGSAFEVDSREIGGKNACRSKFKVHGETETRVKTATSVPLTGIL